jgi:hypothetical protein
MCMVCCVLFSIFINTLYILIEYSECMLNVAQMGLLENSVIFSYWLVVARDILVVLISLYFTR